MAGRTLITVPKSAKRGEIIEIRALVQHPMETGYRRSSEGAMLPRDLIRTFSCRFLSAAPSAASNAGELVFGATLHAAIAANPYLSFNLRAEASGSLVFEWLGDNGFAYRETLALLVA
jgi:sulfur-oxidizing protein SoxZ